MRKNKILLIMILFLVVLSSSVYAVQEVTSVKLPNYFTTSMQPNTWYYKNVNLSQYKGLDLSLFEISLTADYSTETKIIVRVENTLCRPNVWTTPNQTSLNYQATFDCTNYFDSSSIDTDSVAISYKVSNPTVNMKPEITLFYYNNIKANINVLGTYYEVGDTAKVIAQLSRNGLPINTGSCFASIYHPDNSIHVRDTVMTNVADSDGLYTYSMTIPPSSSSPSPIGVWPVSVSCDYETSQFNIPPFYGVYNHAVQVGGNFTDIWYDDGVLSHLQTEHINNTDLLDVELYYNLSNVIISPLTNLFVSWQGYTDIINETAGFYWYDYNESKWEKSFNELTSEITDTTFNRPEDNHSLTNYIQNDIVKVKINGSILGSTEKKEFFYENFEDNNVDPFTPVILQGATGINFGTDIGGINGTNAHIYGDGDASTIEEGYLQTSIDATNYTNISLTYSRYVSGSESNELHYVSVLGNSSSPTFVLNEDWETGNLNSQDNLWAESSWYSSGSATVRSNAGEQHSGTYGLRLRNTGYVDRGIDFSGATGDVTISFWAKSSGLDVGDVSYFNVETNSNTNTYTTLKTWLNGDDDDIWHYYEFNISDYPLINLGSNSEIAFSSGGNANNDKLFIDDINITIHGSEETILESWYGNSGLTTQTYQLGSQFDNVENITLRFYSNINYYNDYMGFDDVRFDGYERRDYNMYTDFITMNVIQPVGVVNEIRGGGEFNVKDRLNGIENSLENITSALGVTSSEKYAIKYTMPLIYSPNDSPIISLYLYDSENPSMGIAGATCTTTIIGSANDTSIGAVQLSEIPLIDNGGGTYYLIPSNPNGWDSGVYQLESNCEIVNEGTFYSIQGFRMEEDYTSFLNEINSTTYLINDINVTLGEVANQTKPNSTEIPFIMIGGTEYNPTDEGLVAIRLTKTFSSGKQQLITGASCTTDIYYPDQSTYITNGALTEYGSEGIYYYNFTVPSSLGVYIYSVDCSEGNKDYYAMNTFHVFPTINVTATNISIDLSNVLSYLDDINSTITTINGTTTNIENIVNDNNNRLILINNSLYNVNTLLNNMNQTINEINTFAQSINATVISIQGTLLDVQSVVYDVNGTLVTIQNNQISINNSINNINTSNKDVLDAIALLNFTYNDTNLINQIAAINTSNQDVLDVVTLLQNYNDTQLFTNLSLLISDINTSNQDVLDIVSLLKNYNDTTLFSQIASINTSNQDVLDAIMLLNFTYDDTNLLNQIASINTSNQDVLDAIALLDFTYNDTVLVNLINNINTSNQDVLDVVLQLENYNDTSLVNLITNINTSNQDVLDAMSLLNFTYDDTNLLNQIAAINTSNQDVIDVVNLLYNYNDTALVNLIGNINTSNQDVLDAMSLLNFTYDDTVLLNALNGINTSNQDVINYLALYDLNNTDVLNAVLNINTSNQDVIDIVSLLENYNDTQLFLNLTTEINNINTSNQDVIDIVSLLENYNDTQLFLNLSSIINNINTSNQDVLNAINILNNYNDTNLVNLITNINTSNQDVIDILNLLNFTYDDTAIVNQLNSMSVTLNNVNSTNNQILNYVTQINSTVATVNDGIINLTGMVVNVGDDITNIYNAVLGINGTVNGIENTVFQINGTVIDIQSNITSLTSIVNDGFTNIDSAFISINDSIVTIDGVVNGINNTVIQIQTTNNNIENIVTAMNLTLDDVQQTVNNIENYAININSTVTNIENGILELNASHQNIIDILNAMNGTMNDIYSINININDSLSSLSGDVINISNELLQVHALALNMNDTIINIEGIVLNISDNLDYLTNVTIQINGTVNSYLSQFLYLQNLITNRTDIIIDGLADVSYFDNINASDYYGNHTINRPNILETTLMSYSFATLNPPLEGDTYRINYFFFDEDSTLVETIQREVIGVGNHDLVFSSENLLPSSLEESYNVWVRVEMLNGYGFYQSFPLQFIGVQKVTQLTDNGARPVLYDVSVNSVYDRYGDDEVVVGDITIKNVGDTPDQDTILTYWLSNEQGDIYGETKEQLLEVPIGSTTLTRTISMPVNSEAGEWKLNAKYETVVQPTIEAYDSFNVITGYSVGDKLVDRIPIQFKRNTVVAWSLFIFGIFILLALVLVMSSRIKKRKVRKNGKKTKKWHDIESPIASESFDYPK